MAANLVPARPVPVMSRGKTRSGAGPLVAPPRAVLPRLQDRWGAALLPPLSSGLFLAVLDRNLSSSPGSFCLESTLSTK